MSADSYRRAVMRRPGRTFDDTHIAKRKMLFTGGAFRSFHDHRVFFALLKFRCIEWFPIFCALKKQLKRLPSIDELVCSSSKIPRRLIFFAFVPLDCGCGNTW